MIRIGRKYSFKYNNNTEEALVTVLDYSDTDVEIKNENGNFFEPEKDIYSSSFITELGSLVINQKSEPSGRIFIPINIFVESFDLVDDGANKDEVEYKSSKINFTRYHAENPKIYESFKKYAFLTIERGFKNYSANGIFELIRWHTGTKGNDTFKVNNIYRPDYARKFEEDFPEHEGFFRKRKLTAKRL